MLRFVVNHFLCLSNRTILVYFGYILSEFSLAVVLVLAKVRFKIVFFNCSRQRVKGIKNEVLFACTAVS